MGHNGNKDKSKKGGVTNYTNNIKTSQLPDGWVIKNQPMSANKKMKFDSVKLHD